MMGSDFDSFDESGLGMFIESVLGVRAYKEEELLNRVLYRLSTTSGSPSYTSYIQAFNPDTLDPLSDYLILQDEDDSALGAAWAVADVPTGVCLAVVTPSGVVGIDHGGATAWTVDPTHSDPNYTFNSVSIGVVWDAANSRNLVVLGYRYSSGSASGGRIKLLDLDDGIEVDDRILWTHTDFFYGVAVTAKDGKIFAWTATDNNDGTYDLRIHRISTTLVVEATNVFFSGSLAGSENIGNYQTALLNHGQWSSGVDPDFVFVDAVVLGYRTDGQWAFDPADLSEYTDARLLATGAIGEVYGRPALPIEHDLTDPSPAPVSGKYFGRSAPGFRTITKGDATTGLFVDEKVALIGTNYYRSLYYQIIDPALISQPSTNAGDEVIAAFSVDSQDYSKQLNYSPVSGSDDPQWALRSSLPSGMTLSATGLLEWAEPAAGTHTIDVLLALSLTQIVHDSFDLIVQDDAPVIIQEADVDVAYGSAYVELIQRSAGDNPVTWSLDAAPATMQISTNGTISWSPVDETGINTITVRSTNAAGFDTMSYDITVEEQTIAPVINEVADGSHDTSLYIQVVSLSAGDTPCTWSLDAAPSGMLIGANTNENNAVFWGEPTVGVHTITVRCTNGAGFDTETWELTVT